MPAHFSPDMFAFLRELRRHNTREWFAANKARYAALVEAPMLRFIVDVGERLPSISASFVADPRRSGGSMYRIHRDTRFSADKSPYKTWVAAHFKHRAAARGVAVPGFYVHLGPGECFGGGGIYHPDMPTLTRIREHIVADPRAWGVVKRAGLELEGDSLKRAPAGFDPAHRFVEDLKRKDFYAGAEFTERQVTSSRFLGTFVEACADTAPLMKFLCTAINLRW